MNRSNAEAIVGETRKVDIAQRTDPSIDSLREEYRRPKVIPFPKDNPYTAEKAALGKKLYFDTRLSAAYVLSCASCHNPGYGWGDGLPKGVGHQMKTLGRRSPTIINAAYGLIFMWDGRAGDARGRQCFERNLHQHDGPVATDGGAGRQPGADLTVDGGNFDGSKEERRERSSGQPVRRPDARRGQS